MEVLRDVRARIRQLTTAPAQPRRRCHRIEVRGRHADVLDSSRVIMPVFRRFSVLLAIAMVILATFTAPASAQRRDTLPTRAAQWPVKTREYVDLWLHGYALLLDDSAQVPLFRRSYREAVTVEKNKRNIVTDLDANLEALRAPLATNATLQGAQFAVLAFDSEKEMDQGFEAFFQSKGEPRRASNSQLAQMIAYLAGYFPTADDREWARKFMNSLKSERTKFHHAWWTEEQRRRTPALAAADSLWQGTLHPALSRFLGGTKQDGGSLVLSLPIEGEGRTAMFGRRQNIIVAPLPDSASSGAEALYVAAHEMVGAVVAPVVDDNITPAQRRAGDADRLSALALVRGGLMLMQRAAPTMAEGYARFYLRVARVSWSGDPVAALEHAFPLSSEFAGTLKRQIDLAFGGI